MIFDTIVPNTLDSPNQNGANGLNILGHTIINTRTPMPGIISVAFSEK